LALDGGEWSASRPGRALAPGKGPTVPIVQEAGWAPEPVWTQRIEEKSFRLSTDCTSRKSNYIKCHRRDLSLFISLTILSALIGSVAGSKPITTNPLALAYINEALVSVMGEMKGYNSQSWSYVFVYSYTAGATLF
jgi:hypothetical protein